jgi:hypothetical protein
LPAHLEQIALDLGVLEPVTATASCGPGCRCATIGFPQECLTCPADIEAAIATLHGADMPSDVAHAISILRAQPAEDRNRIVDEMEADRERAR